MADASALRDPNPWQPITVPIDLKHLGKLAEEICECAAVTTSCIIYGLGGNDPDTGISLRLRFEDEAADVQANFDLVVEHFALSVRGCETDDMFPGAYFGPLARRLNNCGSAIARCVIQGIDEREPVTGKLNREWLQEAISAVTEGFEALIDDLSLDRDRMRARAAKKKAFQRVWHGQLSDTHGREGSQ